MRFSPKTLLGGAYGIAHTVIVLLLTIISPWMGVLGVAFYIWVEGRAFIPPSRGEVKLAKTLGTVARGSRKKWDVRELWQRKATLFSTVDHYLDWIGPVVVTAISFKMSWVTIVYIIAKYVAGFVLNLVNYV